MKSKIIIFLKFNPNFNLFVMDIERSSVNPDKLYKNPNWSERKK